MVFCSELRNNAFCDITIQMRISCVKPRVISFNKLILIKIFVVKKICCRQAFCSKFLLDLQLQLMRVIQIQMFQITRATSIFFYIVNLWCLCLWIRQRTRDKAPLISDVMFGVSKLAVFIGLSNETQMPTYLRNSNY